MSTIITGGRTAAPGPDGMVLYLIGMRINRYWLVWKWFPVLIAMLRMPIELKRTPEPGLVGKPWLMVSGRVLMVWHYWKSFEHLEGYARSADREHLAAWRSFNRRIPDNGAVGIFTKRFCSATTGSNRYTRICPTSVLVR